MAALFERPAQSSQVRRQRLCGNAISVRMLHAIGVDREALDLIAGRRQLPAAELIEQRLALLGSALDDQAAPVARFHEMK